MRRQWYGASLVPYLLVATVHLGALVLGVGWLDLATRVLLMPALAAGLCLLVGRPHGRTWLVPLALGWSWLGDLVLTTTGTASFLLGMAAFGLAHLSYLAACWPHARRSGRSRWPWLVGVYLAWWVGLVAVLLPGVGAFVVPLACYGLALGGNAVVAHGVNRLTGLGAASFVVSDSLLALAEFRRAFDLPGHDFWVMLTYLLAQGLLVWGLARSSANRPVLAAAEAS